MPFRPLPAPFLLEAGAVASRDHAVVDLGAGEGAFTAELEALGLRVAGVDLVRPATVPGPFVVGDACSLPLRTGSCDLLAAANLVRHLLPRHRNLDFLPAWVGLLKPGGSLFVFEDAPRGPKGPAGHYGRLQDLLARLVPDQRGPLVAPDRFAGLVRRQGLLVRTGTWTNTWPLAADAVVALLAGGRPQPGSETDQLMQAVAADGIACGPAWWAQIQRGTP